MSQAFQAPSASRHPADAVQRLRAKTPDQSNTTTTTDQRVVSWATMCRLPWPWNCHAAEEATAPNPDADLIWLCDRLAANRRENLSLYSIDPEAEPDEEAFDLLHESWRSLSCLIFKQKRPTTLEGAQAMARAAVPHIGKHLDGSLYIMDIAEWMAVRVIEFLAGEKVT